MGAAGDADGFVVDLQTDGTGELALQALSRCGCSGSILLLMLLSELSSGHKTAEHRHYEHRALAQDEPPTDSPDAPSADGIPRFNEWPNE